MNLYVLQISRDFVLGSAGENFQLFHHYFGEVVGGLIKKKLIQIPHDTFNCSLANLIDIQMYYF